VNGGEELMVGELMVDGQERRYSTCALIKTLPELTQVGNLRHSRLGSLRYGVAAQCGCGVVAVAPNGNSQVDLRSCR